MAFEAIHLIYCFAGGFLKSYLCIVFSSPESGRLNFFAFVAGESGFILVIQSQELVGNVCYDGRWDTCRVFCDARGVVDWERVSIDYWSQ